MKMFVPIQKVDAAQRLVYGRATDETPDLAGEIFDYETSAPHFKAWSAELEKLTGGKSKGNVRAMHGKVAAGKLNEITFDDAAKAIDVCAHIVDDAEWKKVEAGVYTGFSIGGAYEKRWADQGNPALKRYTAIPSEISIVDLACNPSATFEMIKADGMVEKVAFAPVAPNAPAPDLEQVWKARDGSTFKLKADAVAKNAELDASENLPASGEGDGVKEPAPTAPVEGIVEPAQVETEKTAPAPLAKGMRNVADLADLLSRLRWIAEDAFYEAQDEGDGSTVPAALKDWLVEGAKIFVQMATEEARELIGATDAEMTFDMVLEMAAKGDELTKAGKGSAQVIHDHAVKVGAKCSGEAKKADAGDLAKVTGELADATGELEKAKGELSKAKADLDETTATITALVKAIPAEYGEAGKPIVSAVEKMVAEIAKFRAQPVQGGPRHIAVSKVIDGTPAPTIADAEREAELAKMAPEDRALALIKSAQSNPIPL